MGIISPARVTKMMPPIYWILSAVLFLWPCFIPYMLITPAEAKRSDFAKESVQADISTRSVGITSSFTGTEIIVFGAVENARRTKDNRNPYDVVVVVEGVGNPLVLRKKSNVAGLWFNTEAIYFSSIPSYYAISTNRPLNKITEPHILDQHGIGFVHISMNAGAAPSKGARVIKGNDKQGATTRW